MRSGNTFLKVNFLLITLFTFCFFGFGASTTHTSKNNYTGNWETSGTWQSGTGNLSNNDVVNIYGFVKRNSDLVLNNNITIHVYDTLFIFGDLDIRQNGYFNVHEGAIVVVFGNVIAFQNVDIDLSSYFVVVGDFTAENNADITAPSDSTVLYVTGSTSCDPTATCVEDSLIGDEEDLLDNPVLGDLVTAYTMVILPSNPILCPGGNVNLNIRSDGSNYQWYLNGTSISGATSYIYSATQTGNYDVSFSIGATNYPRTGTPDPVTVTTGSAVSINSIGSNTPVQAGNSVNLSLDRSTSSPASISGQQWTGPNSYSSTLEDPSFTATAASNTGYYIVTVTSNQNCTDTDSTYVSVTVNCCSGSNYYSKNNYSGNWENTNTWASPNEGWRPLPPPTDGASTGYTQPLCIEGQVTRNGDLTIRSSTYTICDTLIITGDLDIDGISLNITSTGVLIVLGNYNGINASATNSGNVIIIGEVSENYTLSGTGNTYIFDPSPTGNFNSGFIYGDETDLQGNTSLNNFLCSILVGIGFSGGTIGTDEELCYGDTPSLISNLVSPSSGFTFTYSWYYSTDSNNPASGTWNVITDSTQNELYPGILDTTTYFYRKATVGSNCSVNSSVVTKTINPLPTVTATATPDTMCFGNYSDLNATGGISYSWSPSANLDNASAQNPRYTPLINPTSPTELLTTFTVTVTDIKSCVNSETVDVLLTRNPETGPQHHIDDVW